MTKNLFIIDGASGTGKSDMINYINRKSINSRFVTVLSKYTTRGLRDEEKSVDYHLDLEFIEKEQFKEFKKSDDFYSYSYGEGQKIEEYGFFKSKIEEASNYFSNTFIIVRNKALTEQLRNDFPEVRIVNVYIYTDIPQVVKRLEAAGYTEDKINFRIKRQTFAWEDYLRYSQDYDEIIINNSNITDFERLIEQLLTKYNEEKIEYLELSNIENHLLTKPIIGYKKEILKRLSIFPFHRNVFLMMKFRPENEMLFELIRDNLMEYGFNCVRADQPEWNITRNVYNPIAALYCCRYGIALFDKPEEKNEYSPNVAYELGIMHHQLKECLILKHDSLTQIPFDFIKDLYKPYRDNLEIKKIIREWVSTLKANLKK
ncbi:MAG: hypothetical protein ACKVU0_17570 [Saprospiraceae bacterium]